MSVRVVVLAAPLCEPVINARNILCFCVIVHYYTTTCMCLLYMLVVLVGVFDVVKPAHFVATVGTFGAQCVQTIYDLDDM